jgi:Phytoene dehydrogenase and related proteins
LLNNKNEIISLLSNYIENIDDLVETKFLTPMDLNEQFYFPKGNIDHMTLTKNQNFAKRTFSNNPETKFYQYFNNEDIYYCGAGAFPCGSVAGTPGYMCSKQLIKKYS